MSMEILHGDCVSQMSQMSPESVDAIVTDPPYHLTAGKKGGAGVASLNLNSPAGRSRVTTGFMGKVWDGGDVAFRPETWAAALRVLKPGGHMFAFGGTRTYHRMVCAIEDAGFEIRDQFAWVYGSGFPKSLDVSKAIDKAAGHWRGRAGEVVERTVGQPAKGTEYLRADKGDPVTEAAARWQGWGTAAKPAWEPICLARKPLAKGMTVAANVLAHGTGAINVDACRVAGAKPETTRGAGGQHGAYSPLGAQGRILDDGKGRWPANLVHDGSDEVLAGFPETSSGSRKAGDYGDRGGIVYRDPKKADMPALEGSGGSAARFFYCAKANTKDRAGSKHPTVKPVSLMRWLVRMITPPGGVVLDPFAGSGTTGQAAQEEGFRAILIEREAEYVADIRRRLGVMPSIEELLA